MRRARPRRMNFLDVIRGNENPDSEEEDEDVNAPAVQRRRVADLGEMEVLTPRETENLGVLSDESEIEDESEAEEEGEVLSEPIQAALATLKLRRSALLDLHSLELLCVRSVAANLPYFLNKKQPFHGLPAALLTTLMKELNAMHLISNIEIFSQLITPHSRYAMLDFAKQYQWIATDRLRAMTHVSQTCSGSLQHLVLRVNNLSTALCPPRARNVYRLLSTLHNLQHLELSRAGLQDEALVTIATHCRQLRILDVSVNTLITNDGVKVLCGGEHPETDYGCQQLEELDVRNTGVTYSGLYYVLDHLPNIKKLPFPDIDQAILELDNPIQLENVTFSTIRNQLEVDIICNKLPCVNNIAINCHIPNLKPLEKLKNIKTLKINNKFFNVERTLPLVQIYSSTLTCLELEGGTVDLSIIGYHCLYLQSLTWICYAANESKYHLTEEHFSRLETLEMRYPSEQRPFPAWGLQYLMSSQYLSKIKIENITIPDGVLENLVIEAKSGNGGIFSELQSLSMTFCDRINFETVQNIICLAPKLRQIDCCGSLGPTVVWRRVIRFIKKYTPYISVKYIFTPRRVRPWIPGW